MLIYRKKELKKAKTVIIKLNKRGFTITEIVIAVVIFVSVFVGLILMSTSTRTETSKSINYLRALQLAQEAVDWINAAPFSEVTDSNLAFLRGSLVDPSTGESVKLPVGENEKKSISETKYPKDYSKCYYYRTVKIDDIGEIPNSRFLKKVTVGIYWNEGKKPKSIESTSKEPDRMRKLFLSTVIFNNKAYY